jgi:hypothetical protein
MALPLLPCLQGRAVQLQPLMMGRLARLIQKKFRNFAVTVFDEAHTPLQEELTWALPTSG